MLVVVDAADVHVPANALMGPLVVEGAVVDPELVLHAAHAASAEMNASDFRKFMSILWFPLFLYRSYSYFPLCPLYPLCPLCLR
jgi:hypothetical protein